jgi:hypothetical protein
MPSKQRKEARPSSNGSYVQTTSELIYTVAQELRRTLWLIPKSNELRTELKTATVDRQFRRGMTAIRSIAARAEISFMAELLAESTLTKDDLVDAIQSLKNAVSVFDKSRVRDLNFVCDKLLDRINEPLASK